MCSRNSRKNDPGKHKILVVDDQDEVRSLISEYLRRSAGYTVLQASNGREALDCILPNQPVDLVISDINMPGMKGFDLLRIVQERYPATKRVLITAYDIEDYIELAMRHDIGNIFAKTFPFNFSELSTMVENLLNSNIFGPHRYFDADAALFQLELTDPRTIEDIARRITSFLPPSPRSQKMQLVMIELLTNAVFYGYRKEASSDKRDWSMDFILPEQAVAVTAMHDAEKSAVSVVDTGGRLTKSEVLFWLHRQTAPGVGGVPTGIYDHHGRGLYIARRYVDRLIVNIERNKRTEIIVMDYLTSGFAGHKPLYINEL